MSQPSVVVDEGCRRRRGTFVPSGLAGVVMRVGAGILLGGGGGSEQKGARGGAGTQRGRCGPVWPEFWWARVGCECGV